MAGPGRYRIQRKIADGGMAEIFLATQRGAEGFERPVVLKRILAALVADPQFRNMMIDEAHVAMSLNHSNIAQVLDLGQAKGRYFLVLEFVDGWDLNLIINRIKTGVLPLPPQLALYIAAEVCRALSAHAKTRDGKALGIVHRDISPHNVLISEQGEVKLTDFGIAKALGRRERTGAGIIKGKLAFMSPEQASGGSLDARSDLFSVGTMLYLMATGKRPFEAPTDLEAILRVRQCDPPPEAVKPDIAQRLSLIIQRAMKLNPQDRYQSAEEMLIDIESVQRSVFEPAGQTEAQAVAGRAAARRGAAHRTSGAAAAQRSGRRDRPPRGGRPDLRRRGAERRSDHQQRAAGQFAHTIGSGPQFPRRCPTTPAAAARPGHPVGDHRAAVARRRRRRRLVGRPPPGGGALDPGRGRGGERALHAGHARRARDQRRPRSGAAGAAATGREATARDRGGARPCPDADPAAPVPVPAAAADAAGAAVAVNEPPPPAPAPSAGDGARRPARCRRRHR